MKIITEPTESLLQIIKGEGKKIRKMKETSYCYEFLSGVELK